MSSLTIAFLMILLGAAMIYSGWTDHSMRSLLTGKREKRSEG